MSIMQYDTGAAIMRVIDRISQGATPTAACKEERVSVSTFQKYVKQEPTLAALYEEAQQIGHDTLADTLLDIDALAKYANASGDKEIKIASENVKWYLARRNNRYNERVVVEHNITADKAVIDALSRGKQRAFERVASDVVEDAAFTILSEEDEIAAMLR